MTAVEHNDACLSFSVFGGAFLTMAGAFIVTVQVHLQMAYSNLMKIICENNELDL